MAQTAFCALCGPCSAGQRAWSTGSISFAETRWRRWLMRPAIAFDGSSSVATIATWSRCWSRSEEHTSELQSLMRISYAVFCLKNKNDLRSKVPHSDLGGLIEVY